MKTQGMTQWIKTFGMILIMPFLISCQTTPLGQATIEHMECDIAEGAAYDRCVKPCPPTLPVEISRAMTSNLLGPATRDIPAIEKRFDINAVQVPARLFFLSLVQDTPYNVNVHPDVSGTISVQLKKVTIPEVLASIRNVYGFDFRRSARTIEIFPATLQTRSFKINYLDFQRGGDSKTQVAAGGLTSTGASGGSSAVSGSVVPSTSSSSYSSTEQSLNTKISTHSDADFWKELKTAVEAIVGIGESREGREGRKVAVSPMSGLVVVRAMPTELRKVAEFLKNAQLSLNRQVILEAKILEVVLNDSFQAGINWSLLSGGLQATQFGGQVVANGLNVGDNFPILNTDLSGNVNIAPGLSTFNSAGNVGSFGGVFTLAMNYKNLATFIELLSAQGKVQVLSSPRVSTLNNQKALIKVGTDQFFITNVSTTQTSVGTSGNVVPTQNVTFDPFFSGIALDVTPSINQCDEVTLHVHPMVANVTQQNLTYTLTQPGTTVGTSTSQVSQVPLAKSTVRESDSVVRAKSGQMVIIGGLMQDQTQKLKEGLPILKNLPILGNLFTHKVEKVQKSELVILIRPIVVYDEVWTEQMGDTLDRVEKLDTECD